MAADFNKPVLTDNYISILEQLRQNYEVLARMFATGTTAANIPVGSVRFGAGKFQTWNGSAWVDVPLSLDGGGTGAQNAAAARVALGANNAANLTEGTLDAARVPNLDASKIVSGTLTRDTSGNAATATVAASCSGNSATATYATSAGSAGSAGSAAKWTTARTLTIAGSGKSVDGSGNVTWSRSEMGMIGEGQAWTTVSRSFNTTYTNNTGRCIEVRLRTTISGPPEVGAAVFLKVNGVTVDEMQKLSNSFVHATVSAIVPPGHTYTFDRSNVETGVIYFFVSFTELR